MPVEVRVSGSPSGASVRSSCDQPPHPAGAGDCRAPRLCRPNHAAVESPESSADDSGHPLLPRESMGGGMRG